MISISGELRKIIQSGYVNKKTGEEVKQAVLVIEPANTRQNYEVFLSPAQTRNPELLKRWQALKGQQVCVPVTLFVNWDHRFHKFNASGNGEPATAKE